MARKIFLFLIMIGLISFCVKARAAKIQMGDQKFEGKVVVHQDGSVTTESTAKEVDVEGQGKKRLKLKFKEGKLMVADEQGEEMALEEGGRFKKRSLIKERPAQTGDKKNVATETVETQKKTITTKSVKDKKPVIKTQQKTKTKETTVKKQPSVQEKKAVKKDKTTKTKLIAKKTTQKKAILSKSNNKTKTVESEKELTGEIKQ